MVGFLNPYPKAQGFGDRMRGLLDPEVALPVAGALLGNQGNAANFGNALMGLGQGLGDRKKRNQTLEYLRREAPDLADAIESGGMPTGQAWEMFVKQRYAEKPKRNLHNAGDGQLYDADNDSWIQAPNAGANDADMRARDAGKYGLTPDDPAYQGFILTGKMPREDAQTLTATDKKAMWAAEDEIPVLDNTISSLQRAKELNGSTYTGWGADTAGWLGTSMPGGSYIFDQDKAGATAEFGKLMSMEAIQAMAQTLKGATTDSELARFVTILADPATPPEIRGRTIDRMLSLAERVKQVKTSRINEIRGIEGGGSTRMPAGGEGWNDLGNGVRIRQMP